MAIVKGDRGLRGAEKPDVGTKLLILWQRNEGEGCCTLYRRCGGATWGRVESPRRSETTGDSGQGSMEAKADSGIRRFI